jgi:diguanylate cyclase (GGDEF)-like protein
LSRLGQELQLLADTLSGREKELAGLLELVESGEPGLSVEQVLNHIFDRFTGLVPYERISCAFLSGDQTTLTVYWARSGLGPLQVSAGYSEPLAGTGIEQALQSGRPHILNDLQGHLAAHPQSQAARRIVLEGARACLACPLIVRRRCIGFLFFGSRRENAFQEMHQTIFRQIANLVSTVIDNNCSAQNWRLASPTPAEVGPHSPATIGAAEAAMLPQLLRQHAASLPGGSNPIGRSRRRAGDAAVAGMSGAADIRKLVDALIGVRNRTYLQIMERNRRLIEQGENLTEIANRDALTGVLNRGAIMRAVEWALTEASVTQKPLGIIMADIDHFKSINDNLGHGAGDSALKEFTRRLSRAVRQTDQVGRYGGEEFLIIAAGPLTHDTLGKAAERLRQAVAATPFDLGSEARAITASFGAAIATGINETAPDVIDAADRALYAAKNSGRNRVVIAGDANGLPADPDRQAG